MDHETDKLDSRRHRIRLLGWISLLVIVHAYLVFPNARPDLTHFNRDDSEAYIGLADSIATGRGYTRCLNPDQYLPHKTWPPGLPLLIAPAIRVFGLNMIAIKLTMAAVGIVGLVFFYLLMRDLTDTRLAGWATAATALSAHYFWFSHQIMPAVPTFAIAVVVLWLVERASREPSRWRWWVLAGIVTGYGAIIKGLAFLLIPAAGVVVLRAKDRRSTLARYAVFVGIAISPTIGWSIRNSHVEAESLDGINQFRMLFQQTANDPNSPIITPGQLARNVYENVAWGLIYNLPEQSIPGLRLAELRRCPSGRWWAIAISALAALLVCLSIRRGLWPVHVYLAASVALLSVYNTGGTARYFIPLAPLVVFLAAAGIRSDSRGTGLRRFVRLVAVVWILCAAVDFGLAVHQQETRPYAKYRWNQFAEISRRCRDLLPEDAVVIVHNPNAFTLISGHRTWITQPGVPFDLLDALRAGRITHVVISQGGDTRDAERRPWMDDHIEQFDLLGSNGLYNVFAWKASRSVRPSAPP